MNSSGPFIETLQQTFTRTIFSNSQTTDMLTVSCSCVTAHGQHVLMYKPVLILLESSSLMKHSFTEEALLSAATLKHSTFLWLELHLRTKNV